VPIEWLWVFNVVCQNYCRDTSVLASSSELFLLTLAFIYIWWITLPNCWVCYSILYRSLFFSLPRFLLHCLDLLFRFCFLSFDFSILDSLLLIVTLQIVSLYYNTHTDLLILLYVCSPFYISACCTFTVSFHLYHFSFCHLLVQRMLGQRTFLVGWIRLCKATATLEPETTRHNSLDRLQTRK